MGYQVYWTDEHNRWQGYGVPAVCDWPDCSEEIDHGLAYRCEEHPEWVWDEELDDEVQVIDVGCDLSFCEKHRYEDRDGHWSFNPKPNTREWIRHVLTDDSWGPWRHMNREKVAEYRARIED